MKTDTKKNVDLNSAKTPGIKGIFGLQYYIL